MEAALREATNGYRTAMAEIDAALAGPRTAGERAFLRSVREECAGLHKESVAVVGRLISEASGT